jgi:hypothetical protein
MEIERLPLGQSLADKHRDAELKWRGMPPGIPPEMAIEFMAKLKAGSTVRKLTAGGKILGPAMVSYDRFKKHCELHPEWATEAWRVSKVNCNIGKGSRLRNITHCKHGHSLADARVYYQGGYIKRDCRTCWKIRGQLGGLIKPEAVVRVKAALQNGASVSQIIHGKPTGGGKFNRTLRIVDAAAFYRYRRENAEFDRFVATAIADSNSIGQQIRHRRHRSRAKIEARREEANDYQKILAMFPANFPGKDDAAHDLFVAVFEKSLKREDVRARVKQFISAHNRMFPTNYATFAGRRLMSLDARMFEDGATTLGDTVSRGLWD